MRILALLSLSALSFAAAGQPIQRQDTIHLAGERVREPTSGIEVTIPAGWVGVEPENAEAFLLLPMNNAKAQILILIYKYDHRDSLRNLFKAGLSLGSGVKVYPVEGLAARNNWITAQLETKADRNSRAYAEGRCENGFCAITVLIAGKKELDTLKNSIYGVSDKMVFDNGMGMR